MAYTPGTPAGPFTLGMFSDGRREFAGLVVTGHVHEVAPSITDLLRDWSKSMRRLSVLAAYAPTTANREWQPVSELSVAGPGAAQADPAVRRELPAARRGPGGQRG